MSENVLVQPLFHQRSHSMPVGHGFINNNNNHNNTLSHVLESNESNQHRDYEFKRSSTFKPDSARTQLTTNDGFPLPITKSIASQLRPSIIESKDKTEDEPVFFCSSKKILEVFNYHKKDTSYTVILNCKMDRGFFVSQSHWTCYRRNYFQVTGSFIIPGHSEQTVYALHLNPDKPMQPIQHFFLRLKACTSTSSVILENSDTKTLKNHNAIRPIALTQMTPKRDKGPQREPPSVPVTPSTDIYGCDQVCVTFERLQFRVATANNGKRRASQQFFRLIFELVAQLEDGSHHVVSESYSSPLVVRGRSPGHYNTEPQYEIRKPRKTIPLVQKPYLSPPDIRSPLPYACPPVESRPEDYPTLQTQSYHSRSQSCNDSEYLARSRQVDYPPQIMIQQQQQHDNRPYHYNVGIERALRNWQHQVVRQRTESANSYMSTDTVDRGTYSQEPIFQSNPAPQDHYSPYPYHFQPKPSVDSHWSHHRQP